MPGTPACIPPISGAEIPAPMPPKPASSEGERVAATGDEAEGFKALTTPAAASVEKASHIV